jgi:hypothetical protein
MKLSSCAAVKQEEEMSTERTFSASGEKKRDPLAENAL